ncbi:MAG: LytTR family transcriptional regulator DNA-binding domain-containing protein [Lachnospiraceae bacterium]|nr:LytTR family transcriptional regulator DNA-binding domain-containing protein [Lachnospiraceae bacterium]
MLIKILKIARSEPEELEIRCHEETEEVKDIITFVKSRQGKLTGICEGQQHEIPIADVYYVETVDNSVFIYGQNKVYETKQKLYELEGMLREKYFLRVSKSLVLNLMKIKSIKPALNGRYSAILHSGEEVIISRKYVAQLKCALKGEVF